MAKRLTEKTIFFRIKDLKQLLKSPTSGSATYSWTYGGKEIGSMQYTVFADKSRVVLSFYVNNEPKLVYQHVRLYKQPRPFGGVKYSRRCPLLQSPFFVSNGFASGPKRSHSFLARFPARSKNPVRWLLYRKSQHRLQ